MGIGIAIAKDKKTAFVVADYYPAGNYKGQFKQNVLPLC
jgi:hypothetical protein